MRDTKRKKHTWDWHTTQAKQKHAETCKYSVLDILYITMTFCVQLVSHFRMSFGPTFLCEFVRTKTETKRGKLKHIEKIWRDGKFDKKWCLKEKRKNRVLHELEYWICDNFIVRIQQYGIRRC